jgi:hypothetical protein
VLAKPVGALNKIPAVLLCISLVVVQSGLAADIDCGAPKTCRELMTCISVPTSKASLPLLHSNYTALRVLNLRHQLDDAELRELPNLRRSDLVLVRPEDLSNHELIQGLNASKAIFAMAASNYGPEQVRLMLSSTTGRERIFAAIPIDKQGVIAVFGEGTASDASVNNLQKVARSFQQLRGVHLLSVGINESLASEIQKEAEGQGGLLIIVAHNDRAELKFPDGSHLALSSLNATQRKSGRKILVLSCDTITSAESGDANIPLTLKRLNFDNVAAGLKKMQEQLGGTQQVQLGKVISVLQESLVGTDAQQAKTARTVYMIAGGALFMIVAGSLYHWICFPLDDCSKQR